MILVNVWYGAPFFLIMYLAALKSVPEQLYEAAEYRWRQCLAEIHPHHSADDAQYHRHYGAVFADRHLRQFRYRADHDRGRPAQHDPCVLQPGVLLGIRSGDLPLGAATYSLFMFPILAIAAVFILRGVRKRGREIG